MSRVIEIFGCNGVQRTKLHPIMEAYAIDDSAKNNFDGLIGVEIEVEDVKHEDPQRVSAYVWTSTNDGSLRNNGIEFVSKPIAARDAPKALYYLFEQCVVKESCFSPRTSVHVHVDFQQVNDDVVKNFVLMYGVLEKFFYNFIGHSRDKNIYCVPITQTRFMEGMLSKSLGTLAGNWSKYTGLNILTLNNYGTIEFRHMHGTYDYTYISVWIRLIMKLREWVMSQTTDQIIGLVRRFDDTYPYAQLLSDIFGEDAPHLDQPNYREHIHPSMTAVRSAFNRASSVRNVMQMVSRQSPYQTFKAV